MKPHHLLLTLLASWPTSTISTNTAEEIQGQGIPSAPSVVALITPAEAESRPTATLLAQHAEIAAPIAGRFQARQHIVAARTTSEVVTSVTTLPSPTPTPTSTSRTSSDEGDDNETSESDGGEAPSSTVTITITSNRTTTIRPTVTVTSLFSSIGPTTSGASEQLKPTLLSKGFISILLLIFCIGAAWL